MKNHQNFWQVILNLSLITIVLLWINNAAAETLTERIANFPNWENKLINLVGSEKSGKTFLLKILNKKDTTIAGFGNV